MYKMALSLSLALLLLFGNQARADVLKKTVNGSKVERQVAKVAKLYRWSSSVEELKQRAQKSQRMIFWLQIVGELDGGL